jgi:hypothetical protein
MKRNLFLSAILALAVLLSACGASGEAAPATDLVVTDGTVSKTYTLADVQALGAAQATNEGVTYVGVPLAVLLADAGYDPVTVTEVTAVASDGFSSTYTDEVMLAETTLVAYATVDGPLKPGFDGTFRMVVPNGGGKMNARLVVEIRVAK